MDWIFYEDPGNLFFGAVAIFYIIFLGYVAVKDIIAWFKNRK